MSLSYDFSVARGEGNSITLIFTGDSNGGFLFHYLAGQTWHEPVDPRQTSANVWSFSVPDEATAVRVQKKTSGEILQAAIPARQPPPGPAFSIRARERAQSDLVVIEVTGAPVGALEFKFFEKNLWVLRPYTFAPPNAYYFNAGQGWNPAEAIATDQAGNAASCLVPSVAEPEPEPEEPKPSVPYFEDRNMGADTEDTPPNPRNPFDGPGEYPSVVFLHQQRLGYAASFRRPLTVWLSQAGNFESMAASIPPADDDAIEATLAATQANRILWCQSDRNGLGMGTEGGEWVLSGAEQGALTPANLIFQPQTFHGSQPGLPVLRAGAGLLYMQRGGRVLREFGYNFSADRYQSGDLSLLARHILHNNPVRAWAWQEEPHSIVWCALANGALAGLTYMREHDVVAWHRHSTPGGFVEHLVCIPGDDGLHQLWLVTRRNGARAIERMDAFEGAPFEREAALLAKVVQMNATRAEGRDDWTRAEIEALIASRGFASVQQWWTAYGRDEGVCPWNDPAACRAAGYLYCAPGSGGGARPEQGAHLDGEARLAFQARCVPCLPEAALQNGSSFLRPRKINAVKCRVLNAKPFQARVGQSPALPVPARGANFAELADWALPLGAGWRDGERLELIFDGPDPVTVLGLTTTVELAQLAGGNT